MRDGLAGLALLALASMALAGCAGMGGGTLYDRMGGAPVFDRAMDNVTVDILSDGRVNRRFAGTPPNELKQRLGGFVCVQAGGRCAYHGHDMPTSHRGMAIDDAEFDAMVEDISGGFAKAGVRPAEVAELRALLNGMRGDIVGK